MKPQIILASQSIGRKKLLETLGVPFVVMPADIDEESILHPDPRETIYLRARAKANHTLKNLSSPLALHSRVRLDDGGLSPTLIIAADTMVILDGKLYGKPKDSTEALIMLRTLRGKTHQTVTHTVCLLASQDSVLRKWEQMVESSLTMNPLPDEELQLYLQTYNVLRFAGCYSLDEAPWNLFRKIEGSYTNVIGLPFEVIVPLFHTLHLL